MATVQKVDSTRAASPPPRSLKARPSDPSDPEDTEDLVGPAYRIGTSVTKTYQWPASTDGERPFVDLLSERMEATCLKCAVERNVAPEEVWDVACGTGFVTDFEIQKLPSDGSSLTITAAVKTVQQRQVQFGLHVTNGAGELIADGRHLRAYPTHDEMRAKISSKREQGAALRPGLTGWYTAVVQRAHTGGARETAWALGAVGTAISTSAIAGWLTMAAASACDNALPKGGWCSRPARITVSHLAPTPLGMAILCTAKLISVEDAQGRPLPTVVAEDYDWSEAILKFEVSAVDNSQEEVATGTHSRVLSRIEYSPAKA
eukprot:gnl/TRDRNA2_/TRDRNA2_174631_c0_seq7.p1 gnl/TRDRNA2_/TRDRNA2_174631_c0~~gnl/TRDRNA2_/TRDRNA2_174631_c0_seq7.p1  ORF type:complete len:329 (+),score=40.50 gnl/TRDRNA2_/TRDRNA2_174631_c0_seq7:36-989(+)